MDAKYYTVNADTSVTCTLCPHGCTIKNGHVGICGTRRNSNGKLVLTSEGIIASSNLDPIEKKPLYHYHPDSKIFSIGGYGCNLKCKFCQNSEISQCVPTGYSGVRDINPQEIIDKALNLPNNLGIAYTYNEPTVFFEFMLETARRAKEAGLKNVMVTNGYINLAPLSELLGVIDAFNVDLKAFSDDFYRTMTGARLKPVLNTLDAICQAGNHLEIAFLVIPGKNDSPDEAEDMFRWISQTLGKNTVLHINRFYPAYKFNAPPTPVEKLLELYEIATGWLNYVYIGNVRDINQGTNTRCPSCGSTVIKRDGYNTSLVALDSKGYCKICGYGPVVVM